MGERCNLFAHVNIIETTTPASAMQNNISPFVHINLWTRRAEDGVNRTVYYNRLFGMDTFERQINAKSILTLARVFDQEEESKESRIGSFRPSHEGSDSISYYDDNRKVQEAADEFASEISNAKRQAEQCPKYYDIPDCPRVVTRRLVG